LAFDGKIVANCLTRVRFLFFSFLLHHCSSGKTAAFLFPLIAHLLNNGIGLGNPHRPIGYGRFKKYAPYGLILAPTRELALQIHMEAVKFSYQTSLHPCAVYGGADARSQLRELDLGVEVLIATPGRLNDMLGRGRITLQCINYFVMDEVRFFWLTRFHTL